MKTVGVVSDTHGLLRPEVAEAFSGVDLIVHAGDIGAPPVLDPLRKIAPVFAVAGNVDRGVWANALPATEIVEVEGQLLYVLHNLGLLDLDPAVADFRVVVYGHSHDPQVAEKRGVVYLNPGMPDRGGFASLSPLPGWRWAKALVRPFNVPILGRWRRSSLAAAPGGLKWK